MMQDRERRRVSLSTIRRRALEAAPDYADAMFNLALLLQRNNKHAEAVEYWRLYLANDAQSEWAARARRSLKILRNATATLLIAAVFQVAACNAPRCPGVAVDAFNLTRGYRGSGRGKRIAGGLPRLPGCFPAAIAGKHLVKISPFYARFLGKQLGATS
jgi:Tetratricopeptide repeat